MIRCKKMGGDYAVDKMSTILYLDTYNFSDAICDCPDSIPGGNGTCETGADDCTCEDF